jgi:hypothetical protein
VGIGDGGLGEDGSAEADQGKLFHEFRLDDAFRRIMLCAGIDAFVTAVLAELHQKLEPCYSDGRSSVDPKLMIRMFIVMLRHPLRAQAHPRC